MPDREPLRELQQWLPDHLAEDLSVPALARRACMSERNFARAFRDEVGVTPARGRQPERLPWPLQRGGGVTVHSGVPARSGASRTTHKETTR